MNLPYFAMAPLVCIPLTPLLPVSLGAIVREEKRRVPGCPLRSPDHAPDVGARRRERTRQAYPAFAGRRRVGSVIRRRLRPYVNVHVRVRYFRVVFFHKERASTVYVLRVDYEAQKPRLRLRATASGRYAKSRCDVQD